MSYNTDVMWTYHMERASGLTREHMEVSATFYKDNSAYLDLIDKVSSVSITETVNDSKFIVFGSACSNSVDIKLLNLTATEQAYIVDGGKIVLELGVNFFETYISLGTFYVDDIKSVERQNGNKDVTVKAFDGFSKTEKPYVSTIETFPTTPRAIVTDIATQCGIPINTNSWSDTISIDAIKDKLTMRQTIGYMAGVQGCFARFNRDGLLEAAWYSPTTKTIAQNEQYLDGFEQKYNDDVSVAIMETGTSDNPIVFPTSGALVGRSMNFENPYMTQAMANQIGTAKIYDISQGTVAMRIEYLPCSVKWVGNPEIQAGDIVEVLDKSGASHNCYVMSKTMNYDGGLDETYHCYGESESSVSFSPQSPTDQKINRAYTQLEQAIKTATELITGASGGYAAMVSLDGDEYPDNIIVADSFFTESNIDANGRFNNGARYIVRINKNGIGVSKNGGASYDEAITGNGINATCITTGTLSTERLDLDSIYGGIVISKNQVTGLNSDIAEINASVLQAVTAATSANTLASEANSAISAWAKDNDLTYIDGAKIYTGTIAAQSIIIGDYTNYVHVNELTYQSLKYSDEFGEYAYVHPEGGDYTEYFTVDTVVPFRGEFIVGDWINFDNDGSELVFQGDIYLGTSENTVRICLSAALDNGVVVVLQPNPNSDNGLKPLSGDSLIITGTGVKLFKGSAKLPSSVYHNGESRQIVKIRPLLMFATAPGVADAYKFYFRNLSIRRTGTSSLVAGKIEPIDGNVYFDLEKKELAIGDTVNKTSFSVAGANMTQYQGLYHLPIGATGSNNKADAYSYVEFSDYYLNGTHLRTAEIYSQHRVDVFAEESGIVLLSLRAEGTAISGLTEPQIYISANSHLLKMMGSPVYIGSGGRIDIESNDDFYVRSATGSVWISATSSSSADGVFINAIDNDGISQARIDIFNSGTIDAVGTSFKWNNSQVATIDDINALRAELTA